MVILDSIAQAHRRWTAVADSRDFQKPAVDNAPMDGVRRSDRGSARGVRPGDGAELSKRSHEDRGCQGVGGLRSTRVFIGRSLSHGVVLARHPDMHDSTERLIVDVRGTAAPGDKVDRDWFE